MTTAPGLRRSSRDWFSRESGRLYLKRSREASLPPRWAEVDAAGTVDVTDSEASAFGLTAVAVSTRNAKRLTS